MSTDDAQASLITGMDVRQFFQESLQTAVSNQQLDVSDDSLVYLINMLTGFTRSEALYEDTPDGRMIKPLYKFYCEAVEAGTPEERRRALQRLGDVALFISGLFASSLQRSLVDVDYYIAMGGSAYRSLADGLHGSLRRQVFMSIYHELADKFADLVDVLSEVGDSCHPGRDQNLLRLYEIWLLTGSEQAARKLRRSGIQPASAGVSRVRH